MADNKDLKDENADVKSVDDSETTDEVLETQTSDSEIAESDEQSDSSDDTTTNEDLNEAEEASREGFSSGQVTTETLASDDENNVEENNSNDDVVEGEVDGMAAFFDRPDELMQAAAFARLAKYTKYDAFSPFPIHGMDHAMGLGPSWIPWVTFGAGSAGFLLANALQFGMMTFDWPMIVGGKSYAPWPAFIPIMFELTVLLAGITTVIVMLAAAGCFRKPRIIDPDITNDRFVLWISAEDKTFDLEQVKAFMESLDPVEVRTITKGA